MVHKVYFLVLVHTRTDARTHAHTHTHTHTHSHARAEYKNAVKTSCINLPYMVPANSKKVTASAIPVPAYTKPMLKRKHTQSSRTGRQTE